MIAQAKAKSGTADWWLAPAKSKEFAAQILTPKFIAQAREGGVLERVIKEHGIDSDDFKVMSQGILIYRGNRLVRRLQGI